MQRRHFLAAAAAVPLASRAQSAWPSQPVKFLVAFPAGGPTDITMRVLAENAAKLIGQAVVVENRPGAGGTLPAQALPSAPAPTEQVAPSIGERPAAGRRRAERVRSPRPSRTNAPRTAAPASQVTAPAVEHGSNNSVIVR